MTISTSPEQRKGAAIVEFAVLAPFLFFLTLGLFEAARALQVKQMLNDAARKACRTGILPGKANSDITAEINNILTDNSIPTADATITVQVNGTTANASTAKRNDRVSVRISIPIKDVYWISTFFISGSTLDSDSVTMMRQG
jgi:Flp pilus assembly protein TadG